MNGHHCCLSGGAAASSDSNIIHRSQHSVNGKTVQVNVNVHLKGAQKASGKSGSRIVIDDAPPKLSISDAEDEKFNSLNGNAAVKVFDSEKKSWSKFKQQKGKSKASNPLPRFRELNSNDNDPTLNDEEFQNSQGPSHGNGFKFYGAPRKHFARLYRIRPQRRQLTNIVSSDDVKVGEQREYDNTRLKGLMSDAASVSAKAKAKARELALKKAQEQREKDEEELMLSGAQYPGKFLKDESARQISKLKSLDSADVDALDDADFPDSFKVSERIRSSAKKSTPKKAENLKFPPEFLAEERDAKSSKGDLDSEVSDEDFEAFAREEESKKKKKSSADEDDGLEKEFEAFERAESRKKKKTFKFPKAFLRWENEQKENELVDELLDGIEYPQEFLEEERGRKSKTVVTIAPIPRKHHPRAPTFKTSVDPPHLPRAATPKKKLPSSVSAPGEPKRQGTAQPVSVVKQAPYNGPPKREVNAPGADKPAAPKPVKTQASVDAPLDGHQSSVDADGGDALNVLEERGAVSAPDPLRTKASVNAPFPDSKLAVDAPADDTEEEEEEEVTAVEEEALVDDLEKDGAYLSQEDQFWADAHGAAKTLRRQADINGDVGVRDGDAELSNALDSASEFDSADFDSATTAEFVDMDPDANFEDLD